MATIRAYAAESPPTSAVADAASVNLGLEFYVVAAAQLTQIGWWQADPGGDYNTATRILLLYEVINSTTGTEVARTTLAPSGSGWQMATLSTPYTLTVNQRYRAVVFHPDGGYVASSAWFSDGGGSSDATYGGVLVVPSSSNAVGEDQGSYLYWAEGYPTLSFNAANYWVDIQIQTTAGITGDSAPTTTAAIFAAGALGTNRGGARATTVAVVATGGAVGPSSSTWTAAVTAVGAVTPGLSSGGGRATTFAVTATGVANSTRVAAVAVTAGVTATGVTGSLSGSNVGGVFGVTATGIVGQPTTVAVATTASIVAAGVADASTTAAVTVGAGVVAGGYVGLPGGAPIVAVAAAVVATGQAGSTGAASVAGAFAVEAQGEVTGAVAAAAVQAAFTVTADGEVERSRGVALAVTCQVVADGYVGFTTTYRGPQLVVGSPHGSRWFTGGATNVGFARSADPAPATRGNP